MCVSNGLLFLFSFENPQLEYLHLIQFTRVKLLYLRTLFFPSLLNWMYGIIQQSLVVFIIDIGLLFPYEFGMTLLLFGSFFCRLGITELNVVVLSC